MAILAVFSCNYSSRTDGGSCRTGADSYIRWLNTVGTEFSERIVFTRLWEKRWWVMIYAGRNNSGTFNLRKNGVRSKYWLGLFGTSATWVMGLVSRLVRAFDA